MCQTRTALHAPCGRVHITQKCTDKRHCPTYLRYKAAEKKLSSRTPKCDACRGISLPVQIGHSIRALPFWIYRLSRLHLLTHYVLLAFWTLIGGLKWVLATALGVPKKRGGSANWWPKSSSARFWILLRGFLFISLLTFIFSQTLFNGHTPLSTAFTYPILAPLSWTWAHLPAPRRLGLGNAAHWMWEHTPAERQAAVHFLRGVVQYYLTWSWCEMRCGLFADVGWLRGVRVQGCRWACFNEL